MVTELVQTQEKRHQEVLQRVAMERQKSRAIASESAGGLEDFQVGDCVFVARPRKVSKLVHAWTGPWRVIGKGKDVYTVEDTVTNQRTPTHL